MKLLYISGTYYPAAGGAEISMHTFLKEAIRNDHKVLVATNLERSGSNGKIVNYEGVSVVGVDHDSRISKLDELITLYQPDKILTQLMWSDVALKLANDKNIDSVLRFCKVPSFLDITKDSETCPSDIIVVSEFVRDYVFQNWQRESVVIPPPIELKKIRCSRNSPRYITMFNPNMKKGGAIFREVAIGMPKYEFAVVRGWDVLKEGNKIDTKIVQRLCDSLRIQYTGQNLDDVDFEGVHNVTQFSYTSNVSDIYAETRILCVPSQWQEAFGRVCIEGMANGIPVIGSDVGGLAEVVRAGGILINDFMNPNEWVKELKKLDNPEEYERIVKRGRLYVENNYDYSAICNTFFKMLGEK
ncbi:MAG: glycosyltransferase family 4 protein [Nanoarchaeota archaeon]